MPSVTETTVPWFLMSAETPRPSMRLLISSEISAGLSCMFSSRAGVRPAGLMLCWFAWRPLWPSSRQRQPHLLQARAHRRVEHLVAHDHADAADQLGVDHHAGVELAAEALLERGHHLLQLRGVDRERTLDRGV